MITLVVARAKNGAIGKDGDIPWHAPEDLKMFQAETMGGALIMGRHTWESLPVKPLKGRLNIVISRDTSLTEHVFCDIQSAVKFAYGEGKTRLYGIGGAAIYAEMLDMAHRLLLTEVSLEIGDADAFFPKFDQSDWFEIRRSVLRAQGPHCILRDLVRHEM